ncbi:hypothetical protein GCM10027612_87780 [Microbispora bryophytorum subsp. camponoti]
MEGGRDGHRHRREPGPEVPGLLRPDPSHRPAAHRATAAHLARLAHRLQVLAGQIAGADRDHERTVARYRHSTRIAGTAPQIRRAPAATAVDDETLCGRAAGAHAS